MNHYPLSTATATVIGNVDLVKQLNSATVYRLIDQAGAISRVQIAQSSQLAAASITKITRQLLRGRLIKEVDQQVSTGGRRAISLAIDIPPLHALAVRISRTDLLLTYYDLTGNPLCQQQYPVQTNQQTALQQQLFDCITQFQQHHPIPSQLVAISVVLPGIVDPINGIVHYMPHIEVNQWPLCQQLQQRFSVSCYIGHDIRSLALAEHYFGASQHCQDTLFIRLHHGTGAGIIVNGNILLNQRKHNGEIGHLQIAPLDKQCHCGNFGCLETVAANHAIEQTIQHALKQGQASQLTLANCDIHAICQAANQGDPLAYETLAQIGRYLGKAIAIMINLLNPEKIVLAGEICQAPSAIFPAIQQAICGQTLLAFRGPIQLLASQLDHNSAIGAFALVKRALYEGTLLQKILDSGVAE